MLTRKKLRSQTGENNEQGNGRTNIRRILIANNGNAATKFARSVRKWSLETFGDPHYIELVGMLTPDDENSFMEFPNYMDYLIRVPGGPSINNYSNFDQLARCIETYNCDAIWPGWGHASENADAAAYIRDHTSAKWIGPSPEAMTGAGCKIMSTIIAQSLDVPVVSWSGISIRVDPSVLQDPQACANLVKQACISDEKQLLELVDKKVLKYPFMLKAAAGGGGKGIRVVHKKGDEVSAYNQVLNEVVGSPVFAMNCVPNCRHLEVQILGDQYGKVVACGVRDCSIQRRHQKIIEEGPPTCLESEGLEELMRCAERLCSKVGYENAGTVEFLFDIDTKKFYFLEVNSRLQVEHVVTELLMNANLPAAQVMIAMGYRIDEIPDVQRFQELRAQKNLPKRHVIACRIVAEDPEKDFQPSTGLISELKLFCTNNVWGYFSCNQGSIVHPFCDSQIGHIFSTAENRELARIAMLDVLKNFVLRGQIANNILSLQTILTHQDYITGATSTTWLETKKVVQCRKFGPNESVSDQLINAVLYAAVFKADRHFELCESDLLNAIQRGHHTGTFNTSPEYVLIFQRSIKFIVKCSRFTENSMCCNFNGKQTIIRYHHANSALLKDTYWYTMTGGTDAKTRRIGFVVNSESEELSVWIEGKSFSFFPDQDPTKFLAPHGGKLVKWLVKAGDMIANGQALAEIEVLKMYMLLKCEVDGVVTPIFAEGAAFSSGMLLAKIDPTDITKINRAVEYNADFKLLDTCSNIRTLTQIVS